MSEEHRTVERHHGFPQPFRTVQQGHYECDAEAARYVMLYFCPLPPTTVLWLYESGVILLIRCLHTKSLPDASCCTKYTIFDSTGTYPLEKSILMLYIMAVRVRPFIFNLMLTSYAAHITLMVVLQTQKCPKGVVYFHYDGLRMPWFIS